jgi:3-hydroxyacyl-CoA dehydrogenase
MPDRLKKNLAVTHFFNPVKAMKLLEIVPGSDTDPETVEALNLFCTQTLEKGVVIAKDTISFIANRIGCFFMFIGLHKGKEALDKGLSQERVDAILSTPIGLPSTGLYSLYDLIGLDVMEMIGKNFAANLPEGDLGKQYGEFPEAEKEMITNGQFGRKTGGGFFRMTKNEDGSRNKETFDLLTKTWRPQKKEELDINDINILFDDSSDGILAWDVYGATLCYAANLVPIIADDIVSVDRAMQWGFNWSNGPFKAMDNIGPYKIIDKLEKEGIELPYMLKVLKENNAESFYNDQDEQLSPEGKWISI